MGIRTDLTSLGAIGIGTAMAVIGTGAVLFAAVSHGVDATPDRSACLAVSAAPAAPEARRVVTEITLQSTPDVPMPDVRVAGAPTADAPDAPEPRGRRIVVSDRIEVRTECVVERIRAEALEAGEVDAVVVRELVDAVLNDALLNDAAIHR